MMSPWYYFLRGVSAVLIVLGVLLMMKGVGL